MDSMKKKIAYLLLLLMLIPVGSFAKEKRTFEIKDGHFYVNGKVTPISRVRCITLVSLINIGGIAFG